VQRLAENARQATQQISALVSNIQLETADTVSTMNTAITQIVEGSRLAEQAGQQMQLTQQTTAELVASVKQIASSSESQALAGQDLLTRSDHIRQSSEKATAQLHEQASQTTNLMEYAKQLLAAVRVFKLPV
jgi:methyl-accepting chemotaxis protein